MHRNIGRGLVAAALVIAALVPGAAEATSPPLNHVALLEATKIRPSDHAAGDLVRVSAPGELWTGTDGDLHTGRTVAPDAYFRIGSISKTFEATVLFRLEAEHVVDLDESVQHYLPGLLPNTFKPISVRQLLNHTSGLPDVNVGAPAPGASEVIKHRFDYFSFDQLVQLTLRPQGRSAPTPRFDPGTRQEYNSLGYQIAGELIEHLTGHSFKDEVTVRILRPLGLRHTSVPETDPRMPWPHLHGYLENSEGTLVDVSEQGGNPSSMISTAPDLERFISALFTGVLLPPKQTTELFTFPSACTLDGAKPGTACQSAGLLGSKLPDGTMLWGKTGHDLGFASGVFATRDLRRRVVYSVGTTDLNGGEQPPLSQRLAVAISAS